MTDIADLRDRVQSAKISFDQIDQQREEGSKRLVGLIDAVEVSLWDKRGELDRNQIEYERINSDYEQLTDMLHALVRTVKGGRRKRVNNTLRDLAPLLTDLAEARASMGDPMKMFGPPGEKDAAAREKEFEYDPAKVRAGLKRALKLDRPRKAQANGKLETVSA